MWLHFKGMPRRPNTIMKLAAYQSTTFGKRADADTHQSMTNQP